MKKIKKWYSGQTTRAEYIKYMVATAILFLVNYALFFLFLSMESASFPQFTEILFNPFLAAILAVPLFIFYSGLYIRRTRNMINSSSETEVYLMHFCVLYLVSYRLFRLLFYWGTVFYQKVLIRAVFISNI